MNVGSHVTQEEPDGCACHFIELKRLDNPCGHGDSNLWPIKGSAVLVVCAVVRAVCCHLYPKDTPPYPLCASIMGLPPTTCMRYFQICPQRAWPSRWELVFVMLLFLLSIWHLSSAVLLCGCRRCRRPWRCRTAPIRLRMQSYI